MVALVAALSLEARLDHSHAQLLCRLHVPPICELAGRAGVLVDAHVASTPRRGGLLPVAHPVPVAAKTDEARDDLANLVCGGRIDRLQELSRWRHGKNRASLRQGLLEAAV